jgi:hypothetical protein
VGEIADLLAQAVAEIMWVAADAPKRWTQIEPHVQVKVHGTGTIVNLGVPFERVLNRVLRDFLDENLIRGRSFGADMAAVLARDDFRGAPDAMLTWALDDVRLKVSRFDRRNGDAVSSSILLSVSNRTDYGTGRVLITSELASSEHIELIRQLIDSLQE